MRAISPKTTCGQYEKTGDCVARDPTGGAAARKSAAAQVNGYLEGDGK